MPLSTPFRADPVILGYFVLVHGLAIAGLFLPWTLPMAVLAVGLYLAVGLGTTAGLHRLICHRSYQCPRWVEHALVSVAMLTGQGSPLLWAATHRIHHAYSDHEGDVHSPVRSFWYGHIGWIADQNSTHPDDWKRYCRDIADDRYYLWLLRGRLVPQALGVLAVGSTLGWQAVPGAFFLPIVLWMHSTYAVNSACHLPWLGSAPYATGDRSRNFWLVGLLALGEGWHNNHHAFPRSARHGLRWWQLDVAWLFLRGLQALGLAWDLKGPTGKVARAASGADRRAA